MPPNAQLAKEMRHLMKARDEFCVRQLACRERVGVFNIGDRRSSRISCIRPA
jgi:hypothetical protein